MAELPTGTVTFLFTDLENSTGLWEQHPDAMTSALARHDEILRTAVESHHGFVVKSTGDGVHAAFAEPVDAAASAVAAQRALAVEAWGETGPLRVRMGLHTGESESRDGDYYGLAPSRAARLMSAAHGGQIVASRATARLLHDALPEHLELVDLGEHRLRGFTQTEHVYQLGVAGLRAQFPPLVTVDRYLGAFALPIPSFACGGEAFAGRAGELDHLERAWARSLDGGRQVALVAGDPGIGKTRLAAELARRAHGLGALILYGRSGEQAVAPYQPFAEALGPCVASFPAPVLHEQLHGLEVELARVFPELVGRLPDTPREAPVDPEAQRYRLFEAFAALIAGVAASQPAILVLDDLHWADNPTLLLLRHLLRSPPTNALLLVLCYRAVDLPRGSALGDLLADLSREASVTQVSLHGLSETESAALLRDCAGHDLEPELAATLHRETDGNPFFLAELLRHLTETGTMSRLEHAPAGASSLDRHDLPQGVRNVITRRLRNLADPVSDVTRAASVIGPEFDAVLLGRALGLETGTVLDALDSATDAGLVRPVPDRIGAYAFCHSLVRQTIYGDLGSGQRARLHAAVGEALEATAGEPSSAVLANHFEQAIPITGVEKAIRYATRAGRRAVDDLAFEEAAAFFERAIRLHDQLGDGDTAARVDLLTQHAGALVYVDERAGVDAAFRAVDAAETGGSAEQFARAVIVLIEPTYAVTAYGERTDRLVREALARLGDGAPALRARLLAFEAFRSAAYLVHGRDRRALAQEAVTLARGIDDAETLADSLWALAVNLEGTDDVGARLAIGDELVGLGTSAGSRARAFGLRVLAGAHLELADARALDRVIAELDHVGHDERWLPAQVYAIQWRSTQALLEGRFGDVRSLASELRRYARAYRGAAGMGAVQLFFLARELGEIGSASVLEHAAEQRPDSLYPQAMLALALLESGSTGAATDKLTLLDGDDFRLERESSWAAVLALFSEIVAAAGEPRYAKFLYDLLEPFGGRLVCAVLGLACLGAADRYLGMLSATLGDWDRAAAQFDRALALEERIRGNALVLRTRYWQARTLQACGRAADDARVRAIATAVTDDARRLGMHHLAALAAEIGTG